MRRPVLLLAALLLPAALSAAPAQNQGVVIERVLVRVNSEIFTQSQLTERQIEVLREVRSQEANPADFENDQELQAKLREITPDILVTVVDELLLVQHGREQDLEFSDAQFQSALDNIKTQNNLDDAGLKAALEQEGLTLAELRSRFEKTYLIQAVQSEEIGPLIMLTQEEMRQYYNANRGEFMTPATITLREILVTVPTTTQGGREVLEPIAAAAARSEIEAALTRARAGEDFTALAKEVSDAPTSANGGLIGTLNQADINPSLLSALENAEPGELVGPIETPRGYQILKVEARAEPTLEPFDQVRTRIEQRIRQVRIADETRKLLVRLRGQAIIDWKDAELRQQYERRLAEIDQQ